MDDNIFFFFKIYRDYVTEKENMKGYMKTPFKVIQLLKEHEYKEFRKIYLNLRYIWNPNCPNYFFPAKKIASSGGVTMTSWREAVLLLLCFRYTCHNHMTTQYGHSMPARDISNSSMTKGVFILTKYVSRGGSFTLAIGKCGNRVIAVAATCKITLVWISFLSPSTVFCQNVSVLPKLRLFSRENG